MSQVIKLSAKGIQILAKVKKDDTWDVVKPITELNDIIKPLDVYGETIGGNCAEYLNRIADEKDFRESSLFDNCKSLKKAKELKDKKEARAGRGGRGAAGKALSEAQANLLSQMMKNPNYIQDKIRQADNPYRELRRQLDDACAIKLAEKAGYTATEYRQVGKGILESTTRLVRDKKPPSKGWVSDFIEVFKECYGAILSSVITSATPALLRGASNWFGGDDDNRRRRPPRGGGGGGGGENDDDDGGGGGGGPPRRRGAQPRGFNAMRYRMNQMRNQAQVANPMDTIAYAALKEKLFGSQQQQNPLQKEAPPKEREQPFPEGSPPPPQGPREEPPPGGAGGTFQKPPEAEAEPEAATRGGAPPPTMPPIMERTIIPMGMKLVSNPYFFMKGKAIYPPAAPFFDAMGAGATLYQSLPDAAGAKFKSKLQAEEDAINNAKAIGGIHQEPLNKAGGLANDMDNSYPININNYVAPNTDSQYREVARGIMNDEPNMLQKIAAGAVGTMGAILDEVVAVE
jgi:hypothetical protein